MVLGAAFTDINFSVTNFRAATSPTARPVATAQPLTIVGSIEILLSVEIQIKHFLR
jgi:hypothetical protein